MPRFVNDFSENELIKYFEEFGATKESVDDGVRCLHEWLKQQQYLPHLEDDQLRIFLFRGKNELERTKKIIDSYYTIRSTMPEVFDLINPKAEEVHYIISHCAYIPMPELTKDGYRVIVWRLFKNFGKEDVNELSFLRCQQIMLDIALHFDCHKGFIIVYDMENASISFVATMTSFLPKLLRMATKFCPLRYNKIYVANLPKFAEPLIDYAKNFIRQDLSNRIIIWRKSLNELGSVFGEECVSKDLGGKEKSLIELLEEYLQKTYLYEDWFLSEKKKKADLTKKPLASKLASSEFGVEGSFRRICLD